MYNYRIAKQLYFEGLNIRISVDQESTTNNYQEAISKQKAAIALKDRAAYFFNELGVLYSRMKMSIKAKSNYNKAIEMAPE